MDLEQAIKTAIGYETQVLDVYRRSAGDTKAELDNLRGLGFWLDFQEFDLESG